MNKKTYKKSKTNYLYTLPITAQPIYFTIMRQTEACIVWYPDHKRDGTPCNKPVMFDCANKKRINQYMSMNNMPVVEAGTPLRMARILSVACINDCSDILDDDINGFFRYDATQLTVINFFNKLDANQNQNNLIQEAGVPIFSISKAPDGHYIKYSIDIAGRIEKGMHDIFLKQFNKEGYADPADDIIPVSEMPMHDSPNELDEDDIPF